MPVSLGWVEERLTVSLLVLEIPNGLHSQLTHSLTHTLTPPDMPPGVFSQSPGPEQIQANVQYYAEPWEHGTPFHLI
jgi:hypothetical protein